MKHVVIGLHGKARIWLNEDAGAAFEPSHILERHVEAGANLRVESKSVAVEVLLPQGGRSEYALLGVDFSVNKGSSLVAGVAVCRADGPKFRDSMAAKLDDARIGLPEEYSAAVLDAAGSSATGVLPPGDLFINQAVHGFIGSNRHLFARLATLLVHLIVAPFESSEQLVIEEFQPKRVAR